MKNPYQKESLKTEDFLQITYKLILKKINRIIEIQKLTKNKVSLPLLKEKYEETSKILQTIVLLQKEIDFESERGRELSDILNEIGIVLSEANLTKDYKESLQKYDIVQAVFESFIS